MRLFKFSLFICIATLVLFCHHVDSHHKRGKPLQKCTPTWCLPGEVCHMKNGKPECQCPVACAYDLRPVCGSNNVSYSNLCQFRRAICAKGENITMIRKGSCEPLSTDKKPMRKKKLVCKEVDDLSDGETESPVKTTTLAPFPNSAKPKNKMIQLPTTTLAPAEVEPSPVPTVKPTVVKTTTLAPPKAEPKPEAKEKLNTTTDTTTQAPSKVVTKLKPENIVSSTPNKTTTEPEPEPDNTTKAPVQVEPKRREKSKSRPKDIIYKRLVRCVNNCTQTRNPQCGSDGVDYDNPCHMKLSSCRRNETITKAYDGRCLRGIVTPLETNCDNVQCDYLKQCKILKGYAHCQCSKDCEKTGGFLCGSDNKSYSDECRLDYSNCMAGTNVVKVRNGICGASVAPFYDGNGGFVVSEPYDSNMLHH